MIEIDERLPEVPLDAEVVLHVRRHLRRNIRRRASTAEADLALLFGVEPGEAEKIDLARALSHGDPLHEAARLIARFRGDHVRTMPLGNDCHHVAQCHVWLQQRKQEEPAFDGMLATDLATLLALSDARDLAVAQSREFGEDNRLIPILIEGETGTGKELLARAIHQIAHREKLLKNDQFEAVHVAGLGPDFMNDELFGHVKGAFTDGKSERVGRLESASGGTVLIDEVGDLGREAQVRLLRFLQDHKLSRAGENKQREVRVRVLAATWHDLDRDIKKKKFRLDLLHRLRVGRLRLPPLRERHGVFRDVVPTLLKTLGHGSRPLISRSATDALSVYSWPGNLRELTGALRVAVASASGDVVRLEDLPHHVQAGYLGQPMEVRGAGILSDELPEEAQSDQLRVRIDRVTQHLDQRPPPEVTAARQTVQQFLAQIPDSSEEHQATLADFGEAVRRDQEARRLHAMVDAWKTIQGSGLPEGPADAVAAELDRLAKCAELAHTDAERAAKKVDLDKDPWWKFFGDVARLPTFQGALPDNLRTGMIALLRLLHSASPEIGQHVNAFVKKGGLPAVRAKVVAFLKASHVKELPDAWPDNPQEFTAEHWQRLAKGCSSVVDATRATGFSEKTIKKYFREHGLSVGRRKAQTTVKKPPASA